MQPCSNINSLGLRYTEKRQGAGKRPPRPDLPFSQPYGVWRQRGQGAWLQIASLMPRGKAGRNHSVAVRLIEGAHRRWSGSPRLPAPRAHTHRPGSSSRQAKHLRKPTFPRPAAKRPNGRTALPAPPRPRGGARQTPGGPEGPAPRTPARPHSPGPERKGGEGRRTQAAPSRVRARARPKSRGV